ncbi:hypothetical protein KA005_60095 [bacterium]|nr:hypothetical protein [bacterium]
MSYPVRRCPWCGHELEDPTEPTIITAEEKEKEIWRPCDIPDSYTDTADSGTSYQGDFKIKVT